MSEIAAAHITSIKQAKAAAKRLQREHPEMRWNDALDAVAKRLGYRDWDELQKAPLLVDRNKTLVPLPLRALEEVLTLAACYVSELEAKIDEGRYAADEGDPDEDAKPIHTVREWLEKVKKTGAFPLDTRPADTDMAEDAAPEVPATIRSSDEWCSATFDAAHWLRQATVAQIHRLIMDGFAGEMVEEARSLSKGRKGDQYEVISYVNESRRTGVGGGDQLISEMDGRAAMDWLRKNRKDVDLEREAIFDLDGDVLSIWNGEDVADLDAILARYGNEVDLSRLPHADQIPEEQRRHEAFFAGIRVLGCDRKGRCLICSKSRSNWIVEIAALKPDGKGR